MGRGLGGLCTKMRRGNRPPVARTEGKDAVNQMGPLSCSAVEDKYILDIQTKLDALRGWSIKVPKKNSKNEYKIEDYIKELKESVERLEDKIQYINELQDECKAVVEAKAAFQKQIKNKDVELDNSVQYVAVHPLDIASLKNIAAELDDESNNTANNNIKENQLSKSSSSGQKSNGFSRFLIAVKEKFTKSETRVKDKNTNDKKSKKKNTTKSEGQLAETMQMDTIFVEKAVGADTHDYLEEPAAYPPKSPPSELSSEEKKVLEQYAFIDDLNTEAKREVAVEDVLSKSVDSYSDTNMDKAEDDLMFETYFAKKGTVASFNPAYVN